MFNKPNVATVNFFGLVHGVSSGFTEINAVVQGVRDTVELTGTACPSLISNNLEFVCPLDFIAAFWLGEAYDQQAYKEDGVTGPNGVDFTTLMWADADSYCKGITYNGTTDWRLPTVNELLTFLDKYDENHTDGVADLYTDHNWAVGEAYWSADEGVAGEHHAVYLTTGFNGPGSDNLHKYVSCVRASTR